MLQGPRLLALAFLVAAAAPTSAAPRSPTAAAPCLAAVGARAVAPRQRRREQEDSRYTEPVGAGRALPRTELPQAPAGRGVPQGGREGAAPVPPLLRQRVQVVRGLTPSTPSHGLGAVEVAAERPQPRLLR